MKRINHKKKFLVTIIFLQALFLNNTSAQIVQTFSYTGSAQTFVVPSCVSTMTMEAWGAQGGANWASNVNYGGYAKGTFSVTPGSTLTIYVGQKPNGTTGGFNGGGNGESAGQGGGGASDVRVGGIGYNNRIIVAGGGGGAGYWSSLHVVGGVGGGLTGGDGYRDPSYSSNPGGQGGTQTGSGWGTCVSLSNTLMAGGFGYGGSPSSCGCEGYGGGGGWYGGAGSGNCRGGGGGSGYLLPTATNTLFTSGIRVGHGQVVLSYFTNGSGVSVVPASTAICQGSNVTLNASGVVSYTWSNSSQSTAINVNPSATTNYTVQGTNSLGCISFAVITVSVDSPPSLTVTSTDYSICPGKTFTLNATGSTTYTWTGGASNGASLSPSVTTTYSITGANACGTASTAVTITVTPLPVIAVANPTLICASTSATLLGSSTIPVNYTWSPGPMTGSNIVVGPYNSTTYTLTASDGTCSGTATVLLSTKPNPTVNVSASTSVICQGGTVNLSASGAINYSWTPGNLTGNAISVSPPTSTLFTVVGENSVNCTAMSSQVILVNPSPTINAVANKTLVCMGDLVKLTATGANTYTWDNGSQTNTTNVNPASTTVYSVNGTYTNSGCSSTKTVLVAVFLPTVTINSPGPICLGNTATLTVSGACNYTWSTGPLVPFISVTPTATTIYSVAAKCTSVGVSCTASDTVLVVVMANPTVMATSTRTSICKGEKTILNASGAITYTWNNNVTTNTIQVSPITQTVYNVKGTSADGCENTGTITVKVNPCTGINSYGIPIDISIYPNPNSGVFVVRSSEPIKMTLINELGQFINSYSLPKETDQEINISDLPKGIYFVIGERDGFIFKEKIIISE
jgi:hypothetical protein